MTRRRPAEAPPARDDLERRIRSLGPWFHNIVLGGVRTAPEHFLGDYPAVKWHAFAHAVPADLRGWTVLDIGCNAGFYSIEMKQRGADRVVGVDSDARYLAQARLAAEVCDADVEFVQASVYDLAAWRERFDLVLFMGVLYHLRHPLLALDILHDRLVEKLLVFQSMLRGARDTVTMADDYPFSETGPFDDARAPRLHFMEHRYAGDATNWWIPNRACAEAMLRSAGFEIVAHPETEVFVCEPRARQRPPDEELTWLKR
ncbi:MAG TPA: TIGR04290 family methyltransferase [Luteitalea sp.]|nr:TIGR04290 family methyltransferase [Luteitalea sp.]